MRKNTTFIANNGSSYQVTGKGKVKKIKDLSMLAEVLPSEKQAAGTLNEILFRFLKSRYPEHTTQKNGWVKCKGFKMRYIAESFEMYDELNYGKAVELVDPTPRQVLEAMKKPASLLPTEQESAKNAPANAKKALQNKEQEEQKPEAKSLEQLRSDLLDMIEAVVKKEDKPKTLLETAQGYIPNRGLNVRIGKLLRSYEQKQVRLPKLLSQMWELVHEAEFEQKKPAPKFVGIDFYEITHLKQEGEKITLQSGKEIIETNPSELLARYVISKEPRCMVAVMKVARGEITLEQALENIYQKDKFTSYASKDIKTYSKQVQRLCQEILWEWAAPSPLDYVYDTHLKKGAKVRVLWADYHTAYRGTVTETTGGVRIRYEDGTVEYLLKHQQIL